LTAQPRRRIVLTPVTKRKYAGLKVDRSSGDREDGETFGGH
jgi:hypothetical protein